MVIHSDKMANFKNPMTRENAPNNNIQSGAK